MDEEQMDEGSVPIMNGEETIVNGDKKIVNGDEKIVNGDETIVMSKVSELREQTIKLAESVVEAGGVSGGGTFQWVDSTLVKAVREGSWLLVDGVNICSASVLDRLNAMLEPGGMLTLSERGVVGGTVPSITPHSNFRLFLAMNPLHGEISRAMRNRGIELCMTGQWTRPEDMRSVLLQAGLSSPILHNILVQAHTAVIGCLPVYEQPGICEVKQVGSLTRQLMETGHTPRSSLATALTPRLCQASSMALSQSKPQVKNAVESAIKEVMQKSPSKDDIQWPHFEKQAISIRSLRLGSNMCRVAVCGWLVETLNMAIVKPDVAATWCKAALPLPRPLPTTETSLLCCVMLVLASTPHQDWPLLQAALKHKVDNRIPSEAARLSRKVADAIKYILSDDQCNAAKLLVSSLGATQFYDPRYSLESLSSRGIQKEGLDVESLANKSSLWLWNKLTSWYKEQCKKDEPSIDSKKQDSMTLLDISQAVSQGLVSKKASQHPAVPLLTPLLAQISQLVVSLTNNTDIPITDQEYCQLTTALRWCDCFYQLCQQVIPKSQFHLFLPQLILHWQWVYEEFLQKIPTSWNSFVPEQLTNLVSLMQGILEKEFGALHKLASSVRSKISPAPFTTPESADAQFRLLDIIANLTPSLENDNVNKFLASSLGKEVCGSLINVATEIGTCNSETFESVHEEISTLEETIKEECHWDEEDIKVDSKTLKVSHDLRSTYTYALQIQLWPLKDYLGIMTLYNKPSSELTGTAVEAPGVYREVASALSGPAFRCSSVLGTHKYLALTHSTAAHHTHSYLTYSHHQQPQVKEKISDTLHPSSCLLSYILLAGQRKHGCRNDNSMEEIQTGLHVEKVSQLITTRSTLWKNWATLADPRASYEASFTRYVTMYVTSSMGALANTVGVVPEFNIGAYDLHTAADLASKIAEVPSICLPSECKEKLKELASMSRELETCPNDDLSVKSSLAASLAIVAGVIQANIIGQLEPVDPAQRINLLLKYHNKELEDLESHLLLTDWLEDLRGSITTPAPNQSHPHNACYKNRCNLITSTLSQLNQQVAHRPGETAYPKLKHDFTHFLSNVFVPGNIWTLLSNLESHQTGKTKESFIMKVNVLITSCDNFVKRVIRQYPLYRDLIYPFLQAVTITCEAFRLVVSQSHLKNLSQSCDGSLTHCLELYSAFPAPRDPAQPLNLLSSQLDVASLTRMLLPETKFPGQGKIVNNLVLHAALLDFLSLTLAQHHLDKPTVEMASQLLDEVASVWRQQEEEKALRAQEEESLYKYKSRTMAASKTEDEIQEDEFQEAFPSYDDEFNDMKGMTLDDPVNSDRKEAVETDEVTVGYITDEQLYEVSELHNLLFTSLASTSWHLPAVNKTRELPSQLVPAALLRLRVLQSVLGNAGTIAGSSLDRAVIGTLILGNYSACSLLTRPSTSSLITHPYDIYKDPNTNEVMKVRPLLCAVKDRVDELLVKWPAHPSLEMVNTIIARVLTFPLTSPLMRFVVGLETVLEKAQEWERNAHSGVSLMEQLEAVTNQVLQWRQVELNGWRSCLDTVTHKVATQGRKWWTHLHDTFQAALTKVVPMAEVLKTLKQFLETSTLGDFQTRLQLLYAFHCNAAVLEQTKVSRELLAISWNLCQYYKQFLPLITTTLSKARKPIDKEVKGYVKIARWNDINFFAVRESVAKSHRTLHRHMRNWEKQLRQPVAPILCDANTELNQNHTGAWDKEQDDIKTSASISKPPVPPLIKYSSIALEGSVLSRLSVLTRRCHKLACQMLNKLPYAAYVDEVEGTTTNIITSYQELQAAATKAEGITVSDVRIKKLRSVMTQRRDSLFRLFKVLGSMGVIYTRGNSQWHDSEIDACLSLPPVELDVSHSGQPSLQAACQSWPDCVKYMNRCIGRLTLMLKSLFVPHDDLGPELIKRLRGVSCHLFILAREQRKALSRISDRSGELRLILEDLRAYESQPIASSKMLTSFQKLHAFASSLSLTITETQAVLNVVPRTSTPLVILEDSPGIELEQVDELQRVLEESKSAISYHALKLARAVKHFQNDQHLTTPEYIKLFQDSRSQLKTESQKLKNAIVPTLQPDGRVHPVLSEVNKWVSEWDGASFDPSTVTDTESSAPTIAVGINHLEYCVTRLLLSVESIFKRHCGPKKQDEEESEEDEVKNVLSDALCQNLITDEQDLNAKEIVGMLSKIVKASENQPDLLNELKAALPLFEQYQAVCESVLLSIVSSNRSIAKLTSIILAIFQQLVTNGFCKPKELEDEPAGEGATSFEDSDGTGLGEGEGKKDVSDRFESEDQLESALKDGESEKPGDQDLEEDNQGIEMSEDFEGKQQDLDRQERDENDSDEEDNEDQDFDKQMGETDTGAEKLDEKLWGDDADEEQDGDENRENQDEEDGPGDGEATESKMVAKDENKNKKEKDKEQKEKEKLEEMEDTRQENKMAEEGEELNDNFTDPYGGEANTQEEEEEDMKLPDDMILDDGEANDDEVEDEAERDMMDIAEKGVFPEEGREDKNEQEDKDKEDKDKEEEGEEGAGLMEDKQPENNEEEGEENETTEDQEGKTGDKEVADEEEEESGEETKKDERIQGTEEKMDLGDQEDDDTEKADASEDKNTKSEAEAAEMDTTEGSKDQTKEQPKTETGGQREEDEETAQEEQGQVGEQTEDQEGTGQSDSRTRQDAHKGDSSALVTETSACDQNDMKKPRKPGETDEDRTLGDLNKDVQQGMMTKEKRKRPQADQPSQDQDESKDPEEPDKGSQFEHIDRAEDHMDAQMVDAGTQDQAREAPAPADTENPDDKADEDEPMLETPMEVDEEEDNAALEEKEATSQEGEKGEERERRAGQPDPLAEGETQIHTEGEAIMECMVQRPPESYFHTLLLEDDEDQAIAKFDDDLEKTRREIETATQQPEDGGEKWSQQEARVAHVALHLCEQLRLILEPTQAARLRGDFRTGKRLNMRKVIPYIASQFRKDKIWLRRTQPSKRTYQILVAVDDSESMCEARAGSLAIESVALVTRALTLLEVGQLGVISFGNTTKILHPLDQPYSEAAGAQILANLKFDQKATNFTRMMEDSVALLDSCKTNSSHGNPDTAQLLLILSDGQTQTRSEAVRAAVRTARASRIFIVFLVLDAKDNKYSFYDVLVYEEGRMMPLVESFPFPFFLVVRDIDTLPDALATALRQWFELVTADTAH